MGHWFLIAALSGPRSALNNRRPLYIYDAMTAEPMPANWQSPCDYCTYRPDARAVWHLWWWYSSGWIQLSRCGVGSGGSRPILAAAVRLASHRALSSVEGSSNQIILRYRPHPRMQTNFCLAKNWCHRLLYHARSAAWKRFLFIYPRSCRLYQLRRFRFSSDSQCSNRMTSAVQKIHLY